MISQKKAEKNPPLLILLYIFESQCFDLSMSSSVSQKDPRLQDICQFDASIETLLYCIVLYCTVQYSTVQYSNSLNGLITSYGSIMIITFHIHHSYFFVFLNLWAIFLLYCTVQYSTVTL